MRTKSKVINGIEIYKQNYTGYTQSNEQSDEHLTSLGNTFVRLAGLKSPTKDKKEAYNCTGVRT